MTKHKAIGALELSTFREHFGAYQQQYVIIGGTATLLLLEDAGLSARTTKDLDIVICIESLTVEFVEHFCKFIKAGGYQIWRRSDGQRCLYRFEKPLNNGYPTMIELLSDRSPLFEMCDRLILPLTLNDETVSLSAILLHPQYYGFLLENKRVLDGLTVASEIALIPLKARAFLDLSLKKQNGETVRGDDIRKHKNDVYRLAQLLTNSVLLNVPEIIRNDMKSFIDGITDDNQILIQLHVSFTDMLELKDLLMTAYCYTP